MLGFLFLLVCVNSMLIHADSRCERRGGSCRYTNEECDGFFRPGLCSGPTNRQCCLENSGIGDEACEVLGGRCRYQTQSCPGGNFTRGLCAGPVDRQCCIRGGYPTPAPGPEGNCTNTNIVTRSEWGAREPRSRSYIREPVKMVFVHHTAGRACSTRATCIRAVRNVQRYHMDSRNYNDVGYSWLVGEDGGAYEGRGWGVVGAHTRGYNSQAYAVSLMGDYMSRLPEQAVLQTIKNIISCGVERGYIAPDYELFGHRDGGCTSCPGDLLYLEISTWPHFSTRDIPRNCAG